MVGWARGARIALVGQRFGLLTVLRHVGSNYDGSTYLCRCKCGGEKLAASALLKRGKVKSCGCINRGPPYRRGTDGKLAEIDRHAKWQLLSTVRSRPWVTRSRRPLSQELKSF